MVKLLSFLSGSSLAHEDIVGIIYTAVLYKTMYYPDAEGSKMKGYNESLSVQIFIKTKV